MEFAAGLEVADIDPKWIKRHYKKIYYNDRESENARAEQEFRDFVTSQGFDPLPEGLIAWEHEVDITIDVPPNKIIAIVIAKNELIANISTFLFHLFRKKPKLSTPVYDKNLRLIWPTSD